LNPTCELWRKPDRKFTSSRAFTANIGTIANGRIVIPQYTGKSRSFCRTAQNDLQRINKGTRTIGIITPNFPPLNINATWREFRVSVNEVRI
jgi:hypothetical protein